LVGFLLGLPSAWTLGFFQNQDWVWGLGLMVSGLFISLVTIRYGVRRFRRVLINTPDERRPVGGWYTVIMAYIVPLEFVALIAWWFYQAATAFDREGWWNPFHTFSVGTALFQWGLVIAALLLLNRAWARRVGAGEGE
jgi:NSS family neurotransmitter:Na+ symporter